MRLRYIGKPGLEEYYSQAVSFRQGETKEVSESVGQYLLSTFPGLFQDAEPVVTGDSAGPSIRPMNRQVGPGNKSVKKK